MSSFDLFYWLGVAIAFLIAAGLVLFIVGAAIAFFTGPLCPAFRFGVPELRGEMRFYDRSLLITKENGHALPAEEVLVLPERLNNAWDIPWWAGITTRRSWFFFGFIRLVPKDRT